MALTNQQLEEIYSLDSKKRESGINKYVLSPLGKVLDVLDTDLNIVTTGLKPVFEAINPEVAADVFQRKGANAVPSDYLEKLIPDKNVARVMGFAADLGLSPTTYLAGIGGLTKIGKVAESVSSLKRVGQGISLTSPLAKEVAIAKGAAKPTKKLIEETVLAPSLKQQAEQGQRALVSFGVPFTGKDILQVKGAKILGMAESISKDIAESKIGKAFGRIFSTSTGNPEFDKLRQSIQSLAMYRAGLARNISLEFGKEVHALADKLGKKPKEIEELVTYMAEHVPLGDLPANALLAVNQGNIYEKVIHNRESIDKLIDSMPGKELLSANERLKMHSGLTKIMKNYSSATNVYTAAFKQLPEAIRSEFANLYTRQATLSMLKTIRGDKYQFANVGDVLKEFTKTGDEEAALKKLVGETEYKRIVDQHTKLVENVPRQFLPSAVEVGTATEYQQMKNVLHRLLVQTDNGFSTYYSIWQTNKNYLKQVNPAVFNIMERIASNDAWKVERLVEQFHVPLDVAKKNPEAWDIAQRVRQVNQRILQEEKASGLDTQQFVGNISYTLHVPTKEVREFLEKYKGFKGATRKWTAEHSSMLSRQFINIDTGRVEEAFNLGWITAKQRKALLGPNGLSYLNSKTIEGIAGSGIRPGVEGTFNKEFAGQLISHLGIDQVNALSRNGKLRFLGGRAFDKFFDDNPANQLLIRGLRGARAVTGMELFKAAKPFGTPVAKVVTVPPPGMLFTKVDELKGIAFPEDIAKHLDQYHEAIQLPSAAHPFLTYFDDIQNGWKAWTLSIFPAYHTRNIVGNVWNNFLAGMGLTNGARFYNLATAIQRGKPIQITTKAGERLTGEQLMEEARRYVSVDLGQFRGDLLRYYGEEVKGLRKLSDNKVVNFGLKIGNALENNAKIAHYVWQRENGLSPLDAAASVKKYLFDYTDLTDTERELFKRVLPFYTWTRKNIPLQLEALLTHPRKALGVFKVKNAIELDEEGIPDERLLPDWMVRNFPVRFRKSEKTGNYEYFLLGSWLPLSDIDKIFEPDRLIENMLTPLLKEPIQQAANRDFFTGKEIDRGNEYERLATMHLPKRASHALRNVRVLSEIDRALTSETDLTGKILAGLFGKLYPFNEEQAKALVEKEFKEQKSNLKYQLKRARRKDDEQEIDRVLKEIEKLASKKQEVLQ